MLMGMPGKIQKKNSHLLSQRNRSGFKMCSFCVHAVHPRSLCLTATLFVGLLKKDALTFRGSVELLELSERLLCALRV